MAVHYLVPEGKHLPVSGEDGKPDHRLMAAAHAALYSNYRGQPYAGPDKEGAKKRLRALYESEGMEWPGAEAKAGQGEIPRSARNDSAMFSVVRDGLVRIAVAYSSPPGRVFAQGEKKFSISESDLGEMAKNLDEREAPIDYEHNMTLPVAPPGFLKAAGWMGGPGRASQIEPFRLRDGSEVKMLWSWARFTPAMAAMVKQQEYRYFSPWFKWEDADQYGNGVGTRLKAGAMTNTPFLEDLPPIEISDSDYQQLFGLAARADGKLAAVALSQAGAQLISADVTELPRSMDRNPAGSGHLQGGKTMKCKLLRAADGTHEVHGPDGKIGTVDHDELKSYVQTHPDLHPGDVEGCHAKLKEDGITEGRAAALKDLGCEGLEISAVKAFVDQGRAEPVKTDLEQITACIDKDKGILNAGSLDALLDAEKIKPASFRKALSAETKVSAAFKAGLVKPTNRAKALELCLTDERAFDEFVAAGRPIVDLEARGMAGGSPAKNAAQAMFKQKVEEFAATCKAAGRTLSFDQAKVEFARTAEGKNLYDAVVEEEREESKKK
jgi:hypothetical protein